MFYRPHRLRVLALKPPEPERLAVYLIRKNVLPICKCVIETFRWKSRLSMNYTCGRFRVIWESIVGFLWSPSSLGVFSNRSMSGLSSQRDNYAETGFGNREIGVPFLAKERNVFFRTASRPPVVAEGFFSRWMKRPKREPGNLPPFSAEVKNTWRYNSTTFPT